MSNYVFWTLIGFGFACIIWLVDRSRYIKLYLEVKKRNSNLITTLCDVYIFLNDPVKEEYRRKDLKIEIDNLIRWSKHD
jgi:hypothetical protein